MLARAFAVGCAAGMAGATSPLIADGLPQTAPPQPMIADGTPFRHCSTGAGSCEHVTCTGLGASCSVNPNTHCAECTVTLIADGLPQTAPPQPVIADGVPFRHCDTGAGSCEHVACTGAGASCRVNPSTHCAECTFTLIADGLPQTAPPQPVIADGVPWRHCSTGAGSCEHVTCNGGATCSIDTATHCAVCTMTVFPPVADGVQVCPSCSDLDCGEGVCGLDDRNCAMCISPVAGQVWSDCSKPATFTPQQVVALNKCKQGQRCEVDSMQQCENLKQVACDGKCEGANFWTKRNGKKMCQVCATGSTQSVAKDNGARLAAERNDSARKEGFGAGVIGAIAAAAGACAGGLAAAALVALRRGSGSAEQDSTVYHSKNDGHADV